MSVLIKGMEMPKNCNECPMSVNGYCVVSPKRANGDALNVHETTLWCPLVEVPTPHGDLIDRWELTETAMIDPDGGKYVAVYRADEVDEAPVVIEAEG